MGFLDKIFGRRKGGRGDAGGGGSWGATTPNHAAGTDRVDDDRDDDRDEVSGEQEIDVGDSGASGEPGDSGGGDGGGGNGGGGNGGGGNGGGGGD